MEGERGREGRVGRTRENCEPRARKVASPPLDWAVRISALENAKHCVIGSAFKQKRSFDLTIHCGYISRQVRRNVLFPNAEVRVPACLSTSHCGYRNIPAESRGHIRRVVADQTTHRDHSGRDQDHGGRDHDYVAITSKIKHAIKHKTSPARLAQLLQPSLAFLF